MNALHLIEFDDQPRPGDVSGDASAAHVYHPHHASEEEYAQFIGSYRYTLRSCHYYLLERARFVRAYPNLHNWFSAPLPERVGRLYGEGFHTPSSRVNYKARPYLYFLAFRGYASFDWEWLLAVPRLDPWNLFEHGRLDLGIPELVSEGVRQGYRQAHAQHALRWTIGRMYMHNPSAGKAGITGTALAELETAMRSFGQRADVGLYFGSDKRYRAAVKNYHSHLHMVHVALYHHGLADTEPRRVMPPYVVRSFNRPRMEAVAQRYLAVRRLTDRPTTLERIDSTLRELIGWVVQAYPQIESFGELTRAHILQFLDVLNARIAPRTGLPLAPSSKLRRMSCLSVFFREVAKWEWEDVPVRPLLGIGDLPKVPQRVPRYIPEDELARLMEAIRALDCPYQRAALLIARWSGARRNEIRRLEVNCLDQYPDSDRTPRLHIPAGKTKQERLVPLNEEAAAAIRLIQAERQGDRGLLDDVTGKLTHYLFMRHGKVLGCNYLFDAALTKACQSAGLVTPDGKRTVTPHRFRHTVGTQLAERGAKLHTIMKILGHSSATMSLVYAHISDQTVLKDYQAVLGPGASIVGPFARTLREGGLSADDIDWLQTNFFKTELELGHCLRLPQEGPCECELYLTCAKFVTTREYAPRLRRRRRLELELVADAQARGWLREVERHQCTVRRIEQYLHDLGELVEGSEAQD